jgi:phosphoserine phosphatase
MLAGKHNRMAFQAGHRRSVAVFDFDKTLINTQVARTVLDGKIEILGSQVVPFLGGLIYRRYRMGFGKIKSAKALGILVDNWDYGYSDSATDITLLAHCRHRFLVNPGKVTTRRVRSAFGDRFTIMNWTDTQPMDTNR